MGVGPVGGGRVTITVDEIRVAFRKIRKLQHDRIDLKKQVKEIDEEIDSIYRAIADNLLDPADGQVRMGEEATT